MPVTCPQHAPDAVSLCSHFKGLVRQTTNAHRLVLKSYLMGGEQMQHKMLDQLFASYFEEERDIGCFDSLSNAAVNAGVFPTHAEVSEAPISPWPRLRELNALFPSSQSRALLRPHRHWRHPL
jgi:hypothetical protein